MFGFHALVGKNSIFAELKSTMVDYLFLIPLSPGADEDSLRTRLRGICFDSLAKLKSSYVVWYFGDAEIHRPYFKRIDTPYQTKEERMRHAGDLLSAMPRLARYLVRLDDDDPIRAATFDRAADLDFHVAADRYHYFHDLPSGRNSSQKRPWFANTSIHDYNEALTRVPAIGGAPAEDGKNYLFACDHSAAWHPHYRGKKIYYFPKIEPLYVRVLNPDSITAGRMKTFDAEGYFAYLDGFGDWSAPWPDDMEEVRKGFGDLRDTFFSDVPEYRPKKRRRFRWF